MGTEHSQRPNCRKCGVRMVAGTAIANTLVSGMPDFPGDDGNSRGQTMHYGGTGQMVRVNKCPKCGHSITEAT